MTEKQILNANIMMVNDGREDLKNKMISHE